MQRNIVAQTVLGELNDMNFDFTDDQQSLRDAVQRWVDRGFGFERRHAHRQGRRLHARRSGASWPSSACRAWPCPRSTAAWASGRSRRWWSREELGRGLVLAPVAAGALVAPAVLGGRARRRARRWLPKIADASALVVLAHQERARALPAEPRRRPGRSAAGDGWTLSGTKSLVPAGDEADAFIVPARIAGAADDRAGIALFLVERARGVAGARLPDAGRLARRRGRVRRRAAPRWSPPTASARSSTASTSASPPTAPRRSA